MADIVMPRLSDSMEEGTILTWMKKVGDEIAVGDEIVEIETDKANMAYESDVAGTLTEILAEEGATLPIGSPIAVVGGSGEGSGAATAGPVTAGDPPPPAVAKASSGVGPPTVPPADGASDAELEAPATEDGDTVEESRAHGEGASEGSERIKASPVARRLAKEQGIDLASIEGSGPNGRIVKKDVKKAETAKGEVTVHELSKLQQVVARRMSEAKATAPHFYLQAEIEMSQAVAARGRIKAMAAEGEVVPSFNDMVVKACALALREFPRANGSYRDGRFELYSRVNVGVAVAAQDALVVPTVFDADRKSVSEIARDARALAERVRAGVVTPPELGGGTFTVSNLGMFGVTSFQAVINPPEPGILAVGRTIERPVVHEGQIQARPI